MRKSVSQLFVSLALAAAALTVSPLASADDVKMVGVITKLKVAADGKSAQATLKDAKSGELITINISDDETLDKFKDKRIVPGDEIRLKYEAQDGKNISKYFRKTAGC